MRATVNRFKKLRRAANFPIPSRIELSHLALFANLDLTRVVGIDFWRSLVTCYFSRHANLFVRVFGFRFTKLRSVTAPNENCEYCLGYGSSRFKKVGFPIIASEEAGRMG